MSSAMLPPDEHVLSTLNKDGKRHWLKPRLSRGARWRARQLVAYALILLFVVLPHIKINGKPAILLDIARRKFTVFGFTFLPTDSLLFALLMIASFLTIFLLTAIFGRIWCGWACPQTIYMEFLFRPIERLFESTVGKGGKPIRKMKGWKKVGMYATYLVASLFLAHTFLAYFVGIDTLTQWFSQSPIKHPIPFLVMVGTTFMMMFDFSFFREQMCLIACPYGRFQSVLLDRKSLIVAYDTTRGEPRGKVKPKPKTDSVDLPVVDQGDCVDCKLCVRTCPTGIDIREGLQMECLHCTQCMDACDEIMERVGREKGLIRYSSQDGIDGKTSNMLRARVLLYPFIILGLMVAFVFVLGNKKSFDLNILRNKGNPVAETEEGFIQNFLLIKLVNRGDTVQEYSFSIENRDDVTMDIAEATIQVEPGKSATQSVIVTAPPDAFQLGRLEIVVKITSSNGDTRSATFKMLGGS